MTVPGWSVFRKSPGARTDDQEDTCMSGFENIHRGKKT